MLFSLAGSQKTVLRQALPSRDLAHGLPPVSQALDGVRNERGQKDALTQAVMPIVRGGDGEVRATWKSKKEV